MYIDFKDLKGLDYEKPAGVGAMWQRTGEGEDNKEDEEDEEDVEEDEGEVGGERKKVQACGGGWVFRQLG